MKVISVLLLTMFLTAVNIIVSLFWYDSFYYVVNQEGLEAKNKLPDNLKLDYWDTDVSKDNFGVVITDTYGSLVLNKGLHFPYDGNRIEILSRYTIQNGAMVVVAILGTGDSVQIKINDDHSLSLASEIVEKRDDRYTDLKDKELLDWLRYQNSYQPNFWVFTFLLSLSIIANFFLIGFLVITIKNGSR